MTPRLVLRSPLASDLQSLHDHVLSDTHVMKMAFAGAPLSFEQSIAFFDANFDHDRSGRKLGTLIERETEVFVGFAGLLPCNILNHQDYELGFMLRRSAWGRGYATEIGLGQAEYGLGKLKLDRILAQAAPHNEASIAVLKKIGMEFHSAAQSAERGKRLVYALYRL